MRKRQGVERQGEPKPKKSKERSSFKWTPELHMRMAEYLCENYDSYKSALGASKKIGFLRKMRDDLEMTCDDKQMSNGFQNFLRKYDEIRQKLNSSGFGVDPEKNATLDKGWIKKACPYFDILDAVMACRPNVIPPSVIATANLKDVTQMDNCGKEDDLTAETAKTDNDDKEETENNENDLNGDEVPSGSSENDAEVSAEVTACVKEAFRGLKTQKSASPVGRTPLGIISKVMSDKIEEKTKVEREKLKSSDAHFQVEMEIQKERNQIERLKADNQLTIENNRLELEKQKLADKEAERKHEIEKLKLQQEYELKKLELQLMSNKTD